jgi:hypothetical protein
MRTATSVERDFSHLAGGMGTALAKLARTISMQTRTMQTKSSPEAGKADRNKAVRILAKSIYRDLTQQGYDDRQIVNLASELIAEVTAQLASKSDDAQ